MHDAFADSLDRHVEHVGRAFEYARHLYRETPFVRLQRASRNESVVQRNEVYDLCLVEAVAFHGQGVNNDFHQFFADAYQVDLENARETLDVFLEILGDRNQRALRYVARKV